MEEGKIKYLQMIQEIISRMSTISSVIKSFSITLAVAIVTLISGSFVKSWMLWIFVIPLISLMVLDIYYLILERKYRNLYENVRTDKHSIDYSLTLSSEENENVLKCIFSKSILIFYIPIIIMYLITCIFAK